MNSNLAYQEEHREEMLNGQIIAMTPPSVRHNEISFNIALAFKLFLRGRPCKAYSDGVAVFLSETDYVMPDAMIVCKQEMIKEDGIHGTPDLIVEVLSPGTKKTDRGYKRKLYESCGVREYWIVTPSDEAVEVYLLENGEYRLDEVYQTAPEQAVFLPGEREKFKDTIRVSLFDDLSVSLKSVFGSPF